MFDLLHTRMFHRCPLAVLILLAVFGGQIRAADLTDFDRDIRPIFSDKCYKCHGPDAAQRKANLRLDTFEWPAEDPVIVPRDPATSLLVQRIQSEDPEFKMPPPDSLLELAPAEIERLSAWVGSGAERTPHWSFVPVGHPVIPRLDDGRGWIRNPIDAFVLDRLRRDDVAPSGEADRETILRRVTLDLTGLPPTLDEIDAFQADNAPDAYERAVERLLASPAYGERMATDWLDAARYADTMGYQNDRENHVWPWRDWVIRAFNGNLPYDDFLVWQLAGDLLPAPTQDQILATAFNRLHRQTNEGGSVLEEFRVEYVADRTQTYSTAMLGLTVECARCHDHKFDPIDQKDYYGLTAFFANIDEAGMYSHFTEVIPSPSASLYDDEARSRHGQLRRDVIARESDARRAAADARGRFSAWLTDGNRPMPAPRPVVHLSFDTIADGKTPNEAVKGETAKVAAELRSIAGRVGNALEFSGDAGVEWDGAPLADRADAFTLSMWLRIPADTQHAVVCHRSKAAEDAASRGYEVLIENNRPAFSLCHFWPGNAIRVQAASPWSPDKWTQLTVTYDGSSRAAGVRMYRDGKPVAVEVVRDALDRTIRYEREDPGPPLVLGARFRDAGFKGGAIDEFQVFDRALTDVEVTSLADTKPIADRLSDNDATFEYYLATIDEAYRASAQALADARHAEAEFASSLPSIMVMHEMPFTRPVYVLSRGAYDRPEERVEPHTPGAIFPFPEEFPRNRLGLAQWTVDPRNPLTSRVAVNRYWSLFFGRGLVETQEDFGSQGRPPSHPELLDYLARWFIDHGWNVKALHTLIVTSATYRQDSTPRRDLQERDPGNELLARGPRGRLSAEMLRDGALAASGLLVRTIGGPSVKPYQPPGLWEDATSTKYVPDTGNGLYRRTLYTFWKRTQPPPAMLTFDMTNREVCVARRERTSTPLQALVLLNDPQFIEAARVLAVRCSETSDESYEAQIVRVFRSLTGRRPTDRERMILIAAYDEQHALFESDPAGAAAYIQTGDSSPGEGHDVVALASLTAVSQLIMNLDDFVVKR